MFANRGVEEHGEVPAVSGHEPGVGHAAAGGPRWRRGQRDRVRLWWSPGERPNGAAIVRSTANRHRGDAERRRLGASAADAGSPHWRPRRVVRSQAIHQLLFIARAYLTDCLWLQAAGRSRPDRWRVRRRTPQMELPQHYALLRWTPLHRRPRAPLPCVCLIMWPR